MSTRMNTGYDKVSDTVNLSSHCLDRCSLRNSVAYRLHICSLVWRPMSRCGVSMNTRGVHEFLSCVSDGGIETPSKPLEGHLYDVALRTDDKQTPARERDSVSVHDQRQLLVRRALATTSAYRSFGQQQNPAPASHRVRSRYKQLYAHLEPLVRSRRAYDDT